ncbi:hypothetical protein [Phenylobacterium sp.]|uniref:hypothetical protein n=1 Tax=Phenylobacterium sp. TaxID=1871053 RepID=UPI0025DA02A9|nr:hypothetical protein [Phenylobacterium sp.]
MGLEGPGWRVDVAPPRRLAARAQLLIENLFDQSHIEFVHPSTLGNAAARPDPIATEMVETETRFSVWRTVPPMAADDSSRAVFDGLGDYLMARIRVELLGVSLVNSVGSQTFNATADGQMLDLLGEMNFLHGVTPETATSTHYFTAAARNFARDADGISAALMARNDGVVDQDIAVLEAVERHLDALGDVRAEVTFASDAGAMQVRRRMERILTQDGLVRAA